MPMALRGLVVLRWIFYACSQNVNLNVIAMKKQIILCADDYGQNTAISQGIITLLSQKRISATSCMVTTKHWAAHAQWLKPFIGQIELGLHINLTEGNALSAQYRHMYGEQFQSLFKVLSRSWLRRWQLAPIEAECSAQLLYFKEQMGVWPDFIDGHQHIQQLPMIRQVLLNIFLRELAEHNGYMRLVKQPFISQIGLLANIKRKIIDYTGTQALESMLKKYAIAHNSSFAGIYPFAKASSYRDYFQQFLRLISNKGLIMCHPGLAPLADGDTIAKARFLEYRYLISDAFIEDCHTAQVRVNRFQDIA
jgi:chitin disaccharide deacetylase